MSASFILKVYRDALTATKEAIASAQAPFRAREMRSAAELEIAKLDGQLMQKQGEISELCTQYPLNFNAIIEKQDAYDILARRRRQFQTLVKEMFPEFTERPEPSATTDEKK